MTLREMMARHAVAIGRPDHRGESVTHHAKSTGAATTFDALVLRRGRRPIDIDGEVAAWQAVVVIPRTSVPGGVVAGDEIEFSIRKEGDAPTRGAIVNITFESPHGWTVLVQE